MKKKFIILFTSIISLYILTGCNQTQQTQETDDTNPVPDTINLEVMTIFGSSERIPYEAAYKEWEVKTGNSVSDTSMATGEASKNKLISDFDNGEEPDVMYYFNGAEADAIVKANKLVSITDIQRKYEYYADNHNIDLIPASPADGIKYAIPDYGYWNLLYVNKVVLDDCGIELPEKDTTWDDFINICQEIKDKGYVPITVTLNENPNHWFEYAVMNNNNVEEHTRIPGSSSDETGQAWISGLNSIKEFFQKSFFPENTTTITNDEAINLFYENGAAFLLGDSQMLKEIESSSGHPDDFTTIFIPGKNQRLTTDIIANLPFGWYITTKCWNNSEKQAAAVDFVRHMTSDEVIASFGVAGEAVTLKTGPICPENASNLQKDSIATLVNATAYVKACQDLLSDIQREKLLNGIKNILTEEKTAEQVVDDLIAK